MSARQNFTHTPPPSFGAPGPLTTRMIYGGMADVYTLARRAGRSIEDARLEAESAGRRLAELACAAEAASQSLTTFAAAAQDANLHLDDAAPSRAIGEAAP